MLKILSKKEYKRLKQIELTYSKEDLSYSDMVQKFQLLKDEMSKVDKMINSLNIDCLSGNYKGY
jgi:hypothetical protein